MSVELEIVAPAERERRPHDPANPRLVPPIAAGSRDPIVRDLVPYAMMMYTRRGALGSEYRENGKLIFPAWSEMLARPRRKKGETLADYDRRRSEGMESMLRMWLAAAACCDWPTMTLMDPAGGFLSVHRLAELAELPFHLVAPEDEESRDPKRARRNRRYRMDTAERALRGLRQAGIVCYTKQHREQKPDGSYTTTAPALRKLAVHAFRKCGGRLTHTFDWWRGKCKKTRGRHDHRQRGPSPGTDIRIAAALEDINRPRPIASIGRAIVAAAMPTGPARSIPPELLNAVAAEHPDWPVAEMIPEARRRMSGLDPPVGGAGAPPETE